MLDIPYIKTRLAINRIVETMSIHTCGEEEKYFYVELEGGLRFYGFKSPQKLRKYYVMLSTRTKRVLPFAAYSIACDIAIRFIEGGLKFKGPKKELKYKVKQNDFVAEMGAYRGYYTLYLLSQVLEGGRVMAIEPNPENFKLLKKNVEYNGFQNVDLIHGAIWDSSQELDFSMREGDGQSSSVDIRYDNGRGYKVQGYTLDYLLDMYSWQYVNFMLIQLNGAEERALQGLTVLRPANLAIAARYTNQDVPLSKAISLLLRERNYEVEIVDNDYIYATLS